MPCLSVARYVSEIGGEDIDYNVESRFSVKTQTELYNAVSSGYGYVQISDELTGPLIMTGDELQLINDLTIDLNGQEIQRNSTQSILSVPAGKTLSIVDTSAQSAGGMYNPIGSVLTVGDEITNTGGTLNVFAGIFESGPRPEEYYYNIYEKNGRTRAEITANSVKVKQYEGKAENNSTRTLPVFPVVTGSSNIYFDHDVEVAGSAINLPRDSYWYVVVSGANDDVSSFNTEDADYAYSYFVNADGSYADVDASDETLREVMIFGYLNDIAKSTESVRTVIENGEEKEEIYVPYYSAVSMHGGTLNVNVIGDSSNSGNNNNDNGDKTRNAHTAGSFYSYFGTWQTSCIYMTGGNMTVNTTGEMETVDPVALPDISVGDTAKNSAKFSEGACIFSRGIKRAGSDKITGGTLTIENMTKATAYNGSVISVSGGNVTMRHADIEKHATISHADSPFGIKDDDGNSIEQDGGDNTGTEFPEDRQYRDAAVFINGGTLTVSGNDTRDTREGNVSITVNKTLWGLSEYPYSTTFGILSRGRHDSEESRFTGDGLDIKMQGSYSYGIFSTRGAISMTNGSITLDSDNSCYGIYAVNKTKKYDNLVNITLTDTNITVKNKTATVPDKQAGESTLAYQQSVSDNLTYQGAWMSDSDVYWLDENCNSYTLNEAKTGYIRSDGKLYVQSTLNKSKWIPSENASLTIYPTAGVAAGTIEANKETVKNSEVSIMRAASVGVYLDSHDFKAETDSNGVALEKPLGGSVTLDSSTVFSQELGVAVYGGNLTFKNGGGISAYNASAVCLNDGNIIFEDSPTGAGENIVHSNYEINSFINRQSTESSSPSIGASDDYAVKPGIHQYALFLPWDYNGKTNKVAEYANENGIRVMGGNLTANGKLDMCFRGLYNDVSAFGTDGNYYTDRTHTTTAGSNFNNVTIKSFAVACIAETVENADGTETTVSSDIVINYADITSIVGGGVKVQGGNIKLGKKGSNKDDITVTTTGIKRTSDLYYAASGTSADWKSCMNLSGGHAVIARGGNLEVYNGTYTAYFCNGAAVTSDSGSAPQITIHNGEFVGTTTSEAAATDRTAVVSGPLSYYGIKVLGSSTVNINNGTFTGKNGGAMIRGSGSGDSERAKVYIKAGIFGEEKPNKVDGDGLVKGYGQDGFNAYEYSEVYFGTESVTEANQSARMNDIKVFANLFPIAVNPITNNAGLARVYIYYGTYKIRHTGRGATSNANGSNLGIGAISDNMTDVVFYIYGVGNSTYEQGRAYWTGDGTRIRYRNAAGIDGSKVFRGLESTIRSHGYTSAPATHKVGGSAQ